MTGRHRSLPGLLVALLLLACNRPDPAPSPGRLIVAVSILPQVEFAERLGGDHVTVIPVIPPGANPHGFEPSPGQLTALSGARLYALVGSGLPFEVSWVGKLRAVNPSVTVVNCAAGITLIERDPHIWLSPRLAATMVTNLCAGLVSVDPEHRTEYETNRDRYLDSLAVVDRELAGALAGMAGRRFMVYHPSWGYLARDYGLEEIAVEDEGKEPTIQRLSWLVEQARTQGIGTIFVSPQFADRSARTLAAELGIKVIAIDSLAPDYLANLRRVGAQLAAGG
jgi:zinc transport system substrate-binding protein